VLRRSLPGGADCREQRILIRPSDAARFDLRALRTYLSGM
jgi:hypothetical protein